MSEQENIIQRTETPQEEKMVLRAEGLVKKYGKRTVVNGVNFEVRQGEIVGLLGPNGAGKTTSFYMTTGLVVPNGGHVYLNDLEITDFPVYKHAKAGIGYLAQEASVFRKMSVEDNIASVLELTDKPLEYQKEKGKFNALYGMSVTNTIRDNVKYIDESEEWIEEELTNDDIVKKLDSEKKKAFLSFTVICS